MRVEVGWREYSLSEERRWWKKKEGGKTNEGYFRASGTAPCSGASGLGAVPRAQFQHPPRKQFEGGARYRVALDQASVDDNVTFYLTT